MECDIEGKRTLCQQQEAAFHSYLGTGEILAELPFRKRFGSPVGTKVRLMPTTRLSMESGPFLRITSGVKTDRDGFPIGYLARRKDRVLGEQTQD